MYTFIYERSKESSDKIKNLTMTVNDDANVQDMLDVFEQFLRGCGYVFDARTHLEIVPDEHDVDIYDLADFDEENAAN